MKSVRMFYKKTGRMKFISHLDMNRFMTRIIRKSGLDIWYTEGFNKHPYIVFGVPLSLGFESEYEIMDIRLNDDGIKNEEIMEQMNAVLPEYIRVFSVLEPVNKIGKIAFAKYKLSFSDAGALKTALEGMLKEKVIEVIKIGKHNSEKVINLSEYISDYNISLTNGDTVLYITLPVGNTTVNPTLLINKLFEVAGTKYTYSVVRTMLLDENKKEFK